jgi:diguanylate cyclase (GGDEF)-like protein/PAS domain S-box-containing protein
MALPSPPPNCPSILIIDDVLDNLRLLGAALAEEGYQLNCARTGKLALGYLQHKRPSLILLDIQMPGMSGFEVCQQIKQNPTLGDIPILFLSCHDSVEEKLKAFEFGGADYITKPFEVAEVVARVNRQLALQTASHEAKQRHQDLTTEIQSRTQELKQTNQILESTHRELNLEILERRKVELMLMQSKNRLADLLNALDDVVWSATAAPFNLLYLNPAAEKVLGYEVSEFLANPNLWFEIIHPEDSHWVEQSMATLVVEGSFDIEYRIVRPDGDIRHLKNRCTLARKTPEEPDRIDGIIYDITEQKRAEHKLWFDAFHDLLTGLANRNAFMDGLETALAAAKTSHQCQLAVLLIDLDRFKVINDSLGHAAGDQLLMAAARLLEDAVRATDLVARFGGDEFTILLDGITDEAEAILISERILAMMAQPLQLAGHRVEMSASIGIVMGAVDYDCAASLVRDADIAMFRAKELGRTRYEVFQPTMHQRALQRLQIESELRDGLERQQFQLYYQPLVDLRNTQLTGFEALVRWAHPERGILAAGEFIPIAEEAGLITALGDWVLQEACQQLRVWQEQFPQAAGLTMSVNLASPQLSAPGLLERLDALLAQAGVSGEALHFEITESLLLLESPEVLERLHGIRQRAIKLCVDDFGTGYSALGYINRFPIDVIKIDRSFIQAMQAEAEKVEVVRTITQLAHSLSMGVVAEGIETEAQLAQMRSLHCEWGQGYLFAKPLDRDAATVMIAATYGEAIAEAQRQQHPPLLCDSI